MSKKVFCYLTVVVCVALTAVAMPASGQTCGPLDNGRLADVRYEGTQLQFDPIVEFREMVLTIKGPCEDIVRVFEKGANISFDIREIERVTDGQYTWQLSRVASIDPGVQEALQEARGTGEEDDLWWNLFQKGLIPEGPYTDSGSFLVERGLIIDPNSGEEKRAAVGAKSRAAVAGASAVAGAASSGPGGSSGENALGTKDVVYNDDLIVIGSLCVGFDCVNGESFSFDTIRMKENNLRIKFDDTSTAASFPNRDWQLTANDSANGGLSKFSIDDISGSRTPFTIEGNAPSHSLYVDSSGRVGIRTSNPVVDLHVKDGDTPTLRLEQDTSSGFAAQTWDVAGNETSFFVRDATNGSTLPFRIFPGASSNSLTIDDTNSIGVGTTSPGTHDNGGDRAAVHIRRTQATDGGLLIERATASAASDVLLEIRNNGTPRFDMIDTSSGTEWRFEASGVGFNINDLADGGTAEFVVQPDGDVVIEGSLTVGPGGCTGCDLVFSPEYEVESIEEHAAYMWANRHLPGVGPTPEDQPMNLSKKTGGILNELEKAHIYIEELHGTLQESRDEIATLSSENRDLRTQQDRLTEELRLLQERVESLAGQE